MNATLEGQTTAHYLAERLERFPVRLTQLAHGVPVGGELDHLDEGPLTNALRARRPLGLLWRSLEIFRPTAYFAAMAILTILTPPDPPLRTLPSPVEAPHPDFHTTTTPIS